MPIATTIHTEPIGGGEPIAELPAEIISYGYRLNRPGSCSFELALDHPTCSRDIVGDEHEVVVTRNEAEVWRGPIDTPTEDDTKASRTVGFGAEGLESYLKQMFVTSTLAYSSTEQFSIGRGLVDHHQDKSAGDFGIDTSGASSSGVSRSRTYYGFEHKNIYEAVLELAEVNDGFDWHIEASTRLMTFHYPRRGSRKTDLVFDERTIRSFRRSIDRKAKATQILGVGAGEGDDMLRVSLTDAASLSSGKLTQSVYTNKDVKVSATLEDHVRRELLIRKKSPETISITVGTAEPVIFGQYNVGDEGRISWPSPYEPVNKIMRLVGFDIVWRQGTEQAVLHLQDVFS
jgi:hypothetical protein